MKRFDSSPNYRSVGTRDVRWESLVSLESHRDSRSGTLTLVESLVDQNLKEMGEEIIEPNL